MYLEGTIWLLDKMLLKKHYDIKKSQAVGTTWD